MWFFCLGLAFWAPPGVNFSFARTEVVLVLSWDLKPYWEFVEGFQKTDLFQSKVFLVSEWLGSEGSKAVVAVGHRALKKVLEKASPSLPIFGALVLHPRLLDCSRLKGGVYLLLPPEVVWPILRERLKPYFSDTFTVGIPYSTPFNKFLAKKARDTGIFWGIKVKPIPLKEGFSQLEKDLQEVDVLYFLPDPFWESEEVILKIIKMALLRGKIVVGYNRFFLKNGALLAFLIDYTATGAKTARLLKDCLDKNFCRWEPAEFFVEENQKIKKFFLSEKTSVKSGLIKEKKAP